MLPFTIVVMITLCWVLLATTRNAQQQPMSLLATYTKTIADKESKQTQQAQALTHLAAYLPKIPGNVSAFQVMVQCELSGRTATPGNNERGHSIILFIYGE